MKPAACDLVARALSSWPPASVALLLDDVQPAEPLRFVAAGPERRVAAPTAARTLPSCCHVLEPALDGAVCNRRRQRVALAR